MRHHFVRLRTAMLAGATLVLVSGGCQRPHRPGPLQSEPIRAIWVTRWDYQTAADIPRIMEECRQAGFNTVLFQVRGDGTAMYPSRYEPWAREFSGTSPGFDPLALACDEAHRRGMAIHAWVNVIPGWRGKEPPPDRRQLYWAHPDWFWHDARGNREPLGWYNNLNPCYPEVRSYLVGVMHEIVKRYPVDGLHMDYVRYPNEWNNAYPQGAKVPDYPRDPRTVSMFQRATGRTPDEAPALWSQWRADQLTLLVRDIRRMMARTRPAAQLSAAVKADPEIGMRQHFQDTPRWIREGLVDAVYPMNYTDNQAEFEQRCRKWMHDRGRAMVVMGINFDKRSADTVNRQVATATRTVVHFSAFAYNSMFERRDRGVVKPNEQSASRDSLRQSVIPQLRYLASIARRGS